jgi:hypothetical protein
VPQEGKRKGEKCYFPAGENGYCGKHQRNKLFDDGVLTGKNWCRFFFRGCDNELTSQDKEKDILSCKYCRESLNKKQNPCKHEGCIFKVKEEKYCKKHVRDLYYDEEKEKNIKYCDMTRGCFTILTTDKKSCKECLEKYLKKDMERYNKRKNMIINSQQVNATKRTCITCQIDFEPFQTRYLKESLNCKICLKKQGIQDKKRENRVRNYKEERTKNLEMYYKSYIRDAPKREKGDFQLNFETFTKLVSAKCHYCNFKNESETNGIDRINNDIGYTKENCVTACWKCNRMKHFYHPIFFIEKCKIIAKQTTPTKPFYKEWDLYYNRSNYHNFKAYKKEAEKRELSFELTETQWDWLTRSPCYLCGYQTMYGVGIDRVNNTIRKYTMENCRPCCGSCNSMKNELSLEDFLNQCKIISDLWPTTEKFANIPILKNPLKETCVPLKERKHWKSSSLYSAIMSDTAFDFWDSNSDIYTEKEYDVLCETIKRSEKIVSLDILKTLLLKLKKRRLRSKEPDV